MFVRRKTMEAALKEQREQWAKERADFYAQYGEALVRVTALQRQLSAWVMNEPGNITPEQAAQMFYAQDDAWQAAFFNTMQEQILAYHASRPKPYPSAGVPAGEGQWFYAMEKLTNEGFETIAAMYEHAKFHREHA